MRRDRKSHLITVETDCCRCGKRKVFVQVEDVKRLPRKRCDKCNVIVRQYETYGTSLVGF